MTRVYGRDCDADSAAAGRASVIGAAAVTAAVFVAFLPTLSCGFVNFDDPTYVVENPLVREGLSWRGTTRAFTAVTSANWAPLTIISLQLDASLFGTGPWGFHLSNACLHAAACGLLTIAFGRMTGEPVRAAVALAFFGLHPLRVESVAWISERKDVLSVVCLAATLLAYDRYVRLPTPLRGLAVVAGMAMGLLAKSSLVTLPLLLLLLDFWPLRRLPWPSPTRPAVRTLIVEKLPLFLLAALFAAITIQTQRGAIVAADERPLLASRIPNALHALCWYARSLVWPVGLALQYTHMGDKLSAVEIALHAAVIVAAVGLAAAGAARRPYVLWAVGWLVVALLPMIGIVQAGDQGRADRYSYIPHIGPCVALVWWVVDACRGRLRPAWLLAGAAVAIGMLVVLTERQIRVWKDSDALWQHALTVDAQNVMANVMVGTALMERGDAAAAERHYRLAFENSGGASFVCARLARLLFDIGSDDEARRLRDRALAISPDAGFTTWLVSYMRCGRAPTLPGEMKARLREGLARARAGRLAEAVEVFGAVAAAEPECGEALNNLALALGELGRRQESLAAFARAVAANPRNADYRVNYAQALERAGLMAEARAECHEALLNDPTDGEARRLSARLGALGSQ